MPKRTIRKNNKSKDYKTVIDGKAGVYVAFVLPLDLAERLSKYILDTYPKAMHVKRSQVVRAFISDRLEKEGF